ncbi:MAG: hypothetical protein K8S13_12980 [Desulfobacula sp.]|nr:hypothetical protein [Desulfobacula sp.]MCD4720751.1 hypothetical protein [Desulfobacula sp.]
MKTNAVLPDNDGRRSGNDRRVFSYAEHFPERRSGEDRRSGFDRRLKLR